MVEIKRLFGSNSEMRDPDRPTREKMEMLPAEHPDRIAYNMACWREAMELSHTMLMAGLRHKIGPGGDLKAAYKEWNENRRKRKLAAYDRAAQRYFAQHSNPSQDSGKTAQSNGSDDATRSSD